MVAGEIAGNISAEATTPTGNTFAEAMRGVSCYLNSTGIRLLRLERSLTSLCRRQNCLIVIRAAIYSALAVLLIAINELGIDIGKTSFQCEACNRAGSRVPAINSIAAS
jgi:hypothetical protein